jgi:hypothetical protein
MEAEAMHLSASARSFAVEMQEALRIAKVPDLFRRVISPDVGLGEIRVLRRWNSYTPSVRNAWGGGYFLRWNDKGTVVDPGCSFIRLFQAHTSYGIADIDMVIVTHDHLDHSQDVGTLISLFREYNKWLNQEHRCPRRWDLLMSYGTEDQINSLLVHKDNAPFLRWSRVLPAADSDPSWTQMGVAHEDQLLLHPLNKVQPPPFEAPEGETPYCDAALASYFSDCRRTIAADYQYLLTPIPTDHRELFGDRTGFGLRLQLLPTTPTMPSIVISGDTAFDSRLAEFYRGADLVILHVGTMEGASGTRLPAHLGLLGVTGTLSRLVSDPKRRKPRLVVLTEWGYEFGRLPVRGSMAGRSRFTALVEESLHRLGCHEYVAAVPGHCAIGKIPIIPADIGLRISLPDLRVWAVDQSSEQETEAFVPADRVCADEWGDQIVYRAT